MSYYVPALVLEVKIENESVNRFTLKAPGFQSSLPGQYVMAWLPAAGEIPLSLAKVSGEEITLVVEDVGETSRTMNRLVLGDRLYLRGPYGKWFDLQRGRKYLLVAGGVGAVPLLFASQVLAKRGAEIDYVGGGRSARFILFKGDLIHLVSNLYVCTDDGSEGKQCTAFDYAKKLLVSGRYDSVLTCGPEQMMYEVVKLCVDSGQHCEASLVRIIKCAHGVCGSCVIDPGLVVCRDGPVFEGTTLLGTDFGHMSRDEFGRKVKVQ